jgi:hypothetical protein
LRKIEQNIIYLYLYLAAQPVCSTLEGELELRGIDDWLDFWQQRLSNKVSISDIEAEAALSELDRIMRMGIQKSRGTDGKRTNFIDSFYLKQIL